MMDGVAESRLSRFERESTLQLKTDFADDACSCPINALVELNRVNVPVPSRRRHDYGTDTKQGNSNSLSGLATVHAVGRAVSASATRGACRQADANNWVAINNPSRDTARQRHVGPLGGTGVLL